MKDTWVFFLKFKEVDGADIACQLYGNSAMREDLCLERDLIACLVLPKDVFYAFQEQLLGEITNSKIDDMGWTLVKRSDVSVSSVLKGSALTLFELAKKLGISPEHLDRLLHGGG